MSFDFISFILLIFGFLIDNFFFKGLLYPHLRHFFLEFILKEKHLVLSIMDSHGEAVHQALQIQMVNLI